MQQKKSDCGAGRIFRAFRYSQEGLAACYRHEAAFRQELILFALLLPIILLLPVETVWKCLLVFAHTLVLIVELLNSAIEAIVDMVSPDFSTQAKRAKDMGSAAVLLALSATAVFWASALFLCFT